MKVYIVVSDGRPAPGVNVEAVFINKETAQAWIDWHTFAGTVTIQEWRLQ